MAAGGNGNTTYPPFPMIATKTTMVAAMTGSTVIRRIRTPNPQDVLSGRGGGINSHKGNKVFRQWVSQRKEEYNLAQNKKEKIAVAMQVVRQVQQQVPVPGRFLQRDPTAVGGSGGQWWVEIDEAKALAKTTQALREGAPKIRQEHRKTDGESQKSTGKVEKRKRKTPLVAQVVETPVLDDATEKLVLQTVKQDVPSLPRYKSEQLLLPTKEYCAALEQLQENVKKAKHEADTRQNEHQLQPQVDSPMTTIVAPLTSNKAFNEMYGQRNDVGNTKPRFNPLLMPAIDPFAETPPLTAAPEPDISEDIPVLSLDNTRTIVVDNTVPPPAKRNKLVRVHSLALSDVDGTNIDPATNDPVEFVNPFADESNVLMSENGASVDNSHIQFLTINPWNEYGNGIACEVYNDATNPSRMKVRSIGTYLNRLLSFSSSSAVSNEGSFQLPQSSENGILDAFNTDYFFHDDIPDGDTGDGMDSVFEVAHPNLMAQENKNSSSNLIRRKSFTNRNRGVANGRQ